MVVLTSWRIGVARASLGGALKEMLSVLREHKALFLAQEYSRIFVKLFISISSVVSCTFLVPRPLRSHQKSMWELSPCKLREPFVPDGMNAARTIAPPSHPQDAKPKGVDPSLTQQLNNSCCPTQESIDVQRRPETETTTTKSTPQKLNSERKE